MLYPIFDLGKACIFIQLIAGIIYIMFRDHKKYYPIARACHWVVYLMLPIYTILKEII